MSTPCLIGLTLATSGLQPGDHFPLEVGVVAISRKTFVEVDRKIILFEVDPAPALEKADDFVAELHTSNGLFEDLIAAMPEDPPSFNSAKHSVAAQLVDFIDGHGAGGSLGSPLIGFGTGWLQRWCDIWFPHLGRKFKTEIDLTVLLNALGHERTKTNGRANENLDSIARIVADLGALK